MKKILGLAIVSMAIFACNDGQGPSINEDTRDTSATAIETPPPPTAVAYVAADGDVTYKDHKLMVMKNGEWVEAKEDVKLDNGIVINRDGKVKKDGKEVELEDGVIINKEGNFFDKAGIAIENGWDNAKEGAKKAGDEIEKGAKKAGDKVEDAVPGDDNNDDKK